MDSTGESQRGFDFKTSFEESSLFSLFLFCFVPSLVGGTKTWVIFYIFDRIESI